MEILHRQRKEQTIDIETNVILLPHCVEEEKPFSKNVWEYFSAERYYANLRIILDSLPMIDNGIIQAKSAFNDRDELRRFIEGLNLRYKGRISTFKHAIPIVESLTAEIPGLTVLPQEVTQIYALRRLIGRELQGIDQKTVALASSHVTTYAEVMALKALNPSLKLGVTVLDRHADFYVSVREREVRLDYLDIGKRNWLLFLLEQNLVDAISIFGVPGDVYDAITSGTGRKVNRDYVTTHRQVYQKYKERILLANENEYLHTEGRVHRVDTEAFHTQIQNSLGMMSEVGVDHIIFSIDPDVLRTDVHGFTSMEYSNTSVVLNLGIQDFNLAPVEDRDNILIASLFKPILIDDELKDRLQGIPRVVSGHGLSLQMMKQLIETTKNGTVQRNIHMGVPINGGGIFLGDIVELSAPDYERRTTRLIKDLVKQISA